MKIIFPTQGSRNRYPKGNLIQGFGEHPELYDQVSLKYHNGWDITPKIGYGEPVYAPHDGVVVRTRFDGNGYGNEVDILSPAEKGWHLLSILAHLTEEKVVKVGDQVKAGQVVGKMGNSGFVISGGVAYWGNANPDKKGTHLHWTTKSLKEVAPGEPSNTSYLGKNYLIKDYGNGVTGAFDPATLFEGNEMTKYFKISDHGKLGIMILEGFSGTIIFENDYAEYQQLLKITGITDTTPTINIPD